jgi:hypothetical protein
VRFFIFVGSLVFSICSLASEVDANAIKQTQDLLRNPKARQGAIKETQGSQNANDYATKVLGNEQNVNEAYDIAAELLPWITEQSGGDPVKMQEMMAQAMKNPESFYARMPAAQKARIKALNNKIPASASQKKP